VPEQAVISIALHEHAGMGPRLFSHLVLSLGEPEEALRRAEEDPGSLPFIPPEILAKMRTCRERLPEIESRLTELRRRGIEVISFFDKDYPEALRRISEPPLYLYVRGNLPATARCVCVTGTLEPAAAAIADAAEAAKRLAAAGITVVTTFARGIEAAAHVGAIAAGGSNCAFCNCGLESITSPEQRLLGERLGETGCLCSEYPERVKPSASRRKEALRLAVGISSALLVIAADAHTPDMRAVLEPAQREGTPTFFLAAQADDVTRKLLAAGAYPIGDEAGLGLILDYV